MQIGAEMRREPKLGDKLTIQETAVCGYLSCGLTSKEIARQMNLSPRTIEDHRQRLMAKKGARNGPDLVRIVLNEQFAKLNGGTP